jgi:hypothetical protein
MRVGLARLATLPPVTQLELAAGMVAPGNPVDPIVHELLHHAAANSAVNVVMQWRWLRLLRMLLSSPFFSVTGDNRLVALAANLAAIEGVLQPLAEGIALYGEHDCALPDVEQFKRTRYGLSDAIALRLLTLQRGGGTQVGDFAAAARREKLSSGAVTRRADVLCHPLFPRTGNDTYLLGYLTVKAIADRVMRESEAITPAMLVEFLLYYIYEDWALAHLIAAPGLIEIDEMVRHLQRRFRVLLEGEPGQRVAAFTADKRAREERGMLPRGREELEHGPLAGLDLSVDEFAATKMAMVRFWVEWVGPAAPVSDDRLRIDNYIDLTHQVLMSPVPASSPQAASYIERHPMASVHELRKLDFAVEIPERKLPLGTALDVEVEFAIDPTGALHLRPAGDTTWHVSMPAPVGDRVAMADRSGRGRLLGVFMSTNFPWPLYCYLFSGAGLLASWAHDSVFFGEGRWTHDFADHEERLRIADVLVAEREVEGLIYQAQLAELAQVVENSAASHMSADGLDSADTATVTMCDALRELLSGCGWASLFANPPGGENRVGIDSVLQPGNLVTPLAALGLCNTFCQARPDVEAHMADAGQDLNALIAGCEQLQAATGLRLLTIDDHEIRARV